MNNPSTHKKFISPIGRISKVQSVQDYSKKQRVKVDDFFSQNHHRNPRNLKNHQTTDYKALGMGSEFPAIHRDTVKLQHGKKKKIFKDNDLFEISKKDNKPKKQKKEKTLRLDYYKEFNSN